MRNFFRCVFAVILSLIFLCVNSCSDDDFGDQSNSDKGSVDLELADKAWVSTNFDINVNEAEDYADVSIESVVLYFVDSNRGIWLFNLRVQDTDGDAWGTKNELVRFKYSKSGKVVNIQLEDENKTRIQMNLENNKMSNTSYSFTSRPLTSNDRKYMPLFGNCGKNGSSLSYEYWPDICTLTIFGQGDMMDFEHGRQPWAGKRICEVFIKDGVTSIGANFMRGFPELTDLQLTRELKRIGNYAFADDISLVTIWGGSAEPTEIGDYAFAGCTHLKYGPNFDYLTTIGDYAFYGCTDLYKSITLDFSETVETIGDFAFADCVGMTVTFSEGLKSIGKGAFAGTAQRNVRLPESLEVLGEGAFVGDITNVYIGANLRKMDKAIVASTKGTISINQGSAPDAEDVLLTSTGFTSSLKNWVLKVPNGSKTSYSSHSYWKNFTIQTDPSLTNVGNETDDDDVTSSSYDQRLDEEYAASSRRGPVSTSFRGNGTIDDPYLIGSAADLRLLSDMVRKGNIFKRKYFKQTADIIINRNVLTSSGELNGDGSNFEQWIPIGRYYPGNMFCGDYDGNYYTISGIYYNRPQGNFAGLFGKVFGTGVDIKNVILKDSYIKGNMVIGGIVGAVSRSIPDGSSNPNWSNYYKNSNADVCITSCKNYATIIGKGNVGGIIGFSEASSSRYKTSLELSFLANYGKVVGESYVGGIIGRVNSDMSNSRGFYALFNEGPVNGENLHIGGIAGGVTKNVILQNCLNRGSISGGYPAGICGYSSLATITNNVNLGKISGGSPGQIVREMRKGGSLNYNYCLNIYDVPIYNSEDNISIKGNKKLSESEMKSEEILANLNKRKPHTNSEWVKGTDGYPTLKWLSEW